MDWLCIRCHRAVAFKADEMGIDDFGIYFMCPHCHRRNQLECLGRKQGLLLFRQTGK
jgi:hypothetical protein